MNRTVQNLLCVVTIILLFVFLMNIAKAESGTWVLKTGEVVSVPCPSQAAHDDETMTLRLPSGCRVLHPRIGYTVAQDLRLRTEVATLRVREGVLTQEVRVSRSIADADRVESEKVLVDTRRRLDTQTTRAHDAEVALDLERARSRELDQRLTERTILGVSLGFSLGVVSLAALVLAL